MESIGNESTPRLWPSHTKSNTILHRGRCAASASTHTSATLKSNTNARQQRITPPIMTGGRKQLLNMSRWKNITILAALLASSQVCWFQLCIDQVLINSIRIRATNQWESPRESNLNINSEFIICKHTHVIMMLESWVLSTGLESRYTVGYLLETVAHRWGMDYVLQIAFRKVAIRSAFKDSIWKHELGTWELWTFSEPLEVRIRDGSGISAARFKLLRIKCMAVST